MTSSLSSYLNVKRRFTSPSEKVSEIVSVALIAKPSKSLHHYGVIYHILIRALLEKRRD